MKKEYYQIGVFALGALLIAIGKLVDHFVIDQPNLTGVFEEMTIGGVVTFFGWVLAILIGPIWVLLTNRKK